MGGLQGMMGMLPGARKIKSQLAAAHLDDKLIGRQVAIIRSMTRAEKCNTKLLNGSRRRRIAAGSGTEVQDVNRVLKQYREMSKMMKKVGKLSKLGLAQGGLPGMGPGMAPGMAPGGLPPGMGRFGG